MTQDTGKPSGSPTRGRVWRLSFGIGAPLAALALVLLLRPRARPVATGGHEAMLMTASDSARPVSLTAAEAQRIGVTFTTASVGPLAREVRTVGQVTFDETRATVIAPKVEGWVERLFVDYTGMSVQTGAPLLTIYSAMLVSAQEELLLAKRLASDLAAGGGEAARNAEELLQSARRRLSYWDIPASDVRRVEESGEVQRTLTLRASAGGVVIEKNVLAGQKIMTGDALYRIVDLAVVWVEGEVFEQDLALAQVGLSVVAELEAFPGERFGGRIAYIYPTLNPDTRTVRVRVELANGAMRLKPGMYATLRFTGGRRHAVLSVQRSAVLSTGERHLVFVRRPDGQLEPRVVQLGITGEDRVEVLAGLAPGDTVVASATFLVDAESNLGTALGGMGNMPGMDIVTPPTAGPTSTKPNAAPKRSGMDHRGH
jgi:membrane fusion protein, copper/silver efflux system